MRVVMEYFLTLQIVLAGRDGSWRGERRRPRYHPARCEEEERDKDPDDFESLLNKYCKDRNIKPKPKEDFKYTQSNRPVDPEFDARYYRDMYKAGTSEVDSSRDKRRDQPIYKESELRQLSEKKKDEKQDSLNKDKRNDGFTVTSYAPKSDTREKDKIGGYSRTYVLHKYGDSTARRELVDPSKRDDWVVEKRDGRTYFSKRRDSSKDEHEDEPKSKDNRTKGFTGIRYEAHYDQRRKKYSSRRSMDDDEQWSVERYDERRSSSRRRTDSVGSYDDEYSYDSWGCKRKRSRSRSMDRFIQQQVYDSRNRRKSRGSVDSRDQGRKHKELDDQKKSVSKFGRTLYSDVHDGKRDTYKYSEKDGTVDYGEFDARKYVVKSNAVPKEHKKPKLSSTVTVTRTIKKPTLSSTVKVTQSFNLPSQTVKSTIVKSSDKEAKPPSSKSKEKKHSSKTEIIKNSKSDSKEKHPKKSRSHKSKKAKT